MTVSVVPAPLEAPTTASPHKPSPEDYRQGEAVPGHRVVGACAWKAADYKGQEHKFVHTLTEQQIQELDGAVARVLGAGMPIQEVTRAQFELPTLGPVLEDLRKEAQWGRGFVVIRGVPVHRYSRQQAVAAYWGMGTYWGQPVSQNKKGHLIGHIKDIGHDPTKPETRLYATHAAQPFHNDAADLVALLCLSNAPEGGLSSWSSSISVYNEIIARRPDLASVLSGPWFFDRKGEIPVGSNGLPYFELPIANFHGGYLSINASTNYFKLSQRHEAVPRFTQAHLDAMDLFDELAASDELRMDMLLQPGDIQLLSNHTCLHARSEFKDHPDADKRRHLLRLWLSPEDDRPLPDYYRELLGGSVEPGKRGGIRVAGVAANPVPLEAE